MSRFKLRDPNERHEHAGLVSHSIPVPRDSDVILDDNTWTYAI